jgi:hypothetical protein
MLLGGVNIIGFYKVKSNRLWNKESTGSYNYCDYTLIIEKGIIPTINLFVESAAETVTLQVFRTPDNGATEEQIGTDESMVISDMQTNKKLYFESKAVSITEEDYYYLIINNGSDVYYSDVFFWMETTSIVLNMDILKVEVESAQIAINPYSKHTIAAFTHTFYLQVIESPFIAETSQEGIELNSITESLYGSTSIKRCYNVMATNELCKYLMYITNIANKGKGTITLEYRGEDYVEIKDIEIEIKESIGDNLAYILDLKYKNPFETFMVINKIT